MFASSTPATEDPLIRAPRHKKLPEFSNDRIVTIDVHLCLCPLCVIAAYLRHRSGCTDEALDIADSFLHQLSYENDVVFLGDLNADLGLLVVLWPPLALTSRDISFVVPPQVELCFSPSLVLLYLYNAEVKPLNLSDYCLICASFLLSLPLQLLHERKEKLSLYQTG